MLGDSVDPRHRLKELEYPEKVISKQSRKCPVLRSARGCVEQPRGVGQVREGLARGERGVSAKKERGVPCEKQGRTAEEGPHHKGLLCHTRASALHPAGKEPHKRLFVRGMTGQDVWFRHVRSRCAENRLG